MHLFYKIMLTENAGKTEKFIHDTEQIIVHLIP